MNINKAVFSKYCLVVIPFIFLFLVLVKCSVAQETHYPVKVKIVKVVDGDTTIIEKSMDQTNVQDFTKQFQDVKGKNVQVMVTVEDSDKEKNKEKSLSAMHFNLDIDSSMANLFSKAFSFSDSAFASSFAWKDSVENFSRNFDFNFNEEGGMKDFDFDINMENDGKTVTIKNGKGKTIFINREKDSVTVNESENETTKTKTKTIVINDEKQKNKKRVIVSSSVSVIDMDNEKRSANKRGSDKEEDNFSFYPNPSDENFILELNLEGKEEAYVRISNINGKEVYSEKINKTGKISKAINLGENINGTFIVTIKQGKQTSSKKIIIE